MLKAPVIANEGFALLVARGGIEPGLRMPDPSVTTVQLLDAYTCPSPNQQTPKTNPHNAKRPRYR